MLRLLTAASILALLTACGDGQPFFDEDGNLLVTEETDEATSEDGDDADLDPGDAIPPGTDEPNPNNSITRYEAENDNGGGLVTQVSYNAGNDTFTVDNLGFDGANVYSRHPDVGTLNGYAVYVADDFTPDFLTGDPISQVANYSAIFGSSSVQVDGNPRTSFAIVRTGGYQGYGFGGFVYDRNGGVVMPTEGQAQFSGEYAGMRTYTGAGGMDFTRGDIEIAIDFDDFNANDAVQGRVFNREVFDEEGNTVATGFGAGELPAPDILFVIQEGAASIDENGELQGELNNTIINDDGQPEIYEEGFYYGIIAGDTTTGAGGELVGIFVVESEDPRFEGITAQETGGFILNR